MGIEDRGSWAERMETLVSAPPIVKRAPRPSVGGEEVRAELVRERGAEHPDPYVYVHGWVTECLDIAARNKRTGKRPYTGPTRGGGFGFLSLSEAESLCQYLGELVTEGYSIIERAEGASVDA